MKRKVRWECAICGTLFYKKEAHGCINGINKKNWISLSKASRKTSTNKRLPGSQPKRKNKNGIVPAVRSKLKSIGAVSNRFRFVEWF